jgi:hypothetical protein
MQREQLYHKTVDILVQAYFNDTLQHGNCYACAVGNMIAGNMGKRFVKGEYVKGSNRELYFIWDGNAPVYYGDGDDYRTTLTCKISWPISKNLTEYQTQQLISTGYSFDELTEIEKSFEGADKGLDNDEWMFNGLMDVIDVLDIIHENKDEATTKSSKKKFTKETILS